MNNDALIWHDNTYIRLEDATINFFNHSFHYGVGVYEGIRSYKTPRGIAIFRLNDHIARLLDSAKILNIPVAYTCDALQIAHQQVIALNKLENAYIRPLIYYDGDGYIGLHTKKLTTHITIGAFDWSSYLSNDNRTSGIRVMTSSFVRYHPNSFLVKAKSTGKYLSTVLALQDAYNAGFDDAIFLDQDGCVSEGTGSNIFYIKNDIIYTPLTTSALAGVTRNTIMILAKDYGCQVIEKQITRDELYTADEVFFTGTASEIISIREIDHRKIGQGTAGPMTLWLMKLYQDCVQGKSTKYDHWLTYIKHQNHKEVSYESCKRSTTRETIHSD